MNPRPRKRKSLIREVRVQVRCPRCGLVWTTISRRYVDLAKPGAFEALARLAMCDECVAEVAPWLAEQEEPP